MKKYIILFLLVQCLIPLNTIIAQDVIIKRNGEEVKSKVIKVGKKEITYKNLEDPEFSNTNVKVQDVKKIRFEDGTEKLFKLYVQSYLGFSAGKSLALGDYNSGQSNNSKAGYAQSGFQFTLDGGIYLFKNLGLAIAAGRYTNNMDTSAMKFPVPNGSIQYNFDDNSHWSGFYGLIGPLYSFKIGKRFVVDAKIMTGPVSLRKPFWSFHYKNSSNQDYNYNYEPGSGSSLGLNIGTAVRYHFSKRLGIRATVEFMRAKTYIHYNTNISEPFSMGQQRSESNTLIQKVEIVKAGLGLIFLFNR